MNITIDPNLDRFKEEPDDFDPAESRQNTKTNLTKDLSLANKQTSPILPGTVPTDPEQEPEASQDNTKGTVDIQESDPSTAKPKRNRKPKQAKHRHEPEAPEEKGKDKAFMVSLPADIIEGLQILAFLKCTTMKEYLISLIGTAIKENAKSIDLCRQARAQQ